MTSICAITSSASASGAGRRPGPGCGRRPAAPCRGYGAVEFLVALPLLLLFALLALQWIWVLHERSLIEHALQDAVRSGATGYASPDAIESGLARGLEPMWALGFNFADRVSRRQASLSRLRQASAEGWFIWRMVSPTSASFDDWGIQALDENGRPIPGSVEIPNDNLAWRQTNQQPMSGAISPRGIAVVGAASGQTLLDANLIKLEAHVGLPLRVPLAGPIMASVAKLAHGCRVSAPPGSDPSCAVLLSTSDKTPRLPIHLSAVTRMQSPARMSSAVRRVGVASGTAPSDGAVIESRGQKPAEPPLAGRDGLAVESASNADPTPYPNGDTLSTGESEVESVDQSVEIVAVGACLSGCSASAQDAGSCPK